MVVSCIPLLQDKISGTFIPHDGYLFYETNHYAYFQLSLHSCEQCTSFQLQSLR